MTGGFKKLLIALPIVAVLGLVGFYHLFPETVFTLLVRADRSASGLAEKHIQADGLGFAYLEGGAGEALVLLHGFGANKDNWTRISRLLTPHFRVIVPDLIGFGQSDRAPDNDYTVPAQVARVRRFVRALGVARLHLGGSSMGGYIAGTYAARYPDEVQSLLLIAPGGVVAAEPSEMSRRLAEGEPAPLLITDMAGYERMLDFIFYERPFIPGPVKKVLAREAITRRPHHQAIWNQLVGARNFQPLEDRVRGLAVPTLIVWGIQDRVLHVSGADILTAAMPNARAAVLEGVGHLPMIEKPEATARAYLDFRKR
jgi:pimeloyl-ACP methyl ester carboxylesterase